MRGQDETVVGHGLPFACAAFCLLLLCLLLPVLQSTPCTGLSILNNNRHIVQGLGALATLSDSNPFCHLQLLQVGRRPPHLSRAWAGRQVCCWSWLAFGLCSFFVCYLFVCCFLCCNPLLALGGGGRGILDNSIGVLQTQCDEKGSNMTM
jgi:hypothetical protein